MENMPFNYQITAHKQMLFNFAFGFTKNYDDADDLVQDTFVKAIRYANLYTEGSNMQAWLYTILRNTFINNYRKSTMRNKIIDVAEDFTSFQLLKSSATNRGIDRLMSEDINKAFRMLPDVYSVPFLRYFEGYKYCEIAVELGIPLGTVKTRIHVARKLLQSTLKMYN
ncbi:RNA polymerase sigma factor [Pedobacter hartonius]|uniref:RNA polymerase sigma factor n=1 Tax=Pedobacter hartonius TaxID=425514 RepID=A0A1H3W6L4_9SPHI|nr:RNA polymerase sigma factor [Pedobacter hartonius]SDZ82002.1 RNA polymerase sigma-70 factor, ECF subfamily [Pedobacter hartonius]